MNYRPLGRSGLQVSPLCLGGNVFGWTIDEAASFSVLDAWVDAGMNFIDTADVYSRWAPGHVGGESETIIGKWLKKSGRRDRVVIATKVGKDMGDGKVGLAPGYIRRAVEDSLRRLQVDVIDLYQSHDDDRATPLEATLGAYAELIAAGKVRAIGASNYDADRLDEAIGISEAQGLPRYECLQPLYNLLERPAYEAELEPVCVKRGIGVINFYALANGFLSGKYRSEADLSEERGTRPARRQVPEPERPAGAGRARPGGRTPRVDAGRGGARVADRPAEHHPRRSRAPPRSSSCRRWSPAAGLQLDTEALRAIDAASVG